ncbi:hypothetical protein [Streptomyces sp. NPDC001937]
MRMQATLAKARKRLAFDWEGFGAGGFQQTKPSADKARTRE